MAQFAALHSTVEAVQWFPGDPEVNARFGIEERVFQHGSYGYCPKANRPAINPGDWIWFAGDGVKKIVENEATFRLHYGQTEE